VPKAGTPYSSLPDSAYWGRLMKRLRQEGGDASSLGEKFILDSDRVVSFGSCFALNIIPHLLSRGIEYCKGRDHFCEFPDLYALDSFSYSEYSCSYGNVYTARQAIQLFGDPHDQALLDYQNASQPIDGQGLLDLRRPGYPWLAKTKDDFIAKRLYHRAAFVEVISQCTLVIFTIGLTEAWLDKASGACFPVCPGTIAGYFSPDRHFFHDFTEGEIFEDLHQLKRLISEINPDARLLLTVSPVPLVATMQGSNILEANYNSKSRLLLACRRAALEIQDVHYFPSFELVSSSILSDASAFSEDGRTPRPDYIDKVMSILIAPPECSQVDDPLIQQGVFSSSVPQKAVGAWVLGECEESRLDNA